MFGIICNSSERVNDVKRENMNKTGDGSIMGEEKSASGDTFSLDKCSDHVDGETPRKKKKNKVGETLKKKRKRDKRIVKMVDGKEKEEQNEMEHGYILKIETPGGDEHIIKIETHEVEDEMVMEEVDNEMDTVGEEDTKQIISSWHTPTLTPTAPPSPPSFKRTIIEKTDNNNLKRIRVEDTKDITTEFVHGEDNTDDDLTTTSNLNGNTDNLDYSSEKFSKIVKRRRTMENYEDLCKRLLSSPSNVELCPQAPVTIRTGPAVNIRTFYRLPKRKYVSPDLFEICRFILSQEVEVSPVNRVYQEWCRPRLATMRMDEAARQELEKDYGGRFDRYFVEEDLMILNRLEELEREGLVRNRGELCEMLRKPSSRAKRRKCCLLARNILGLWVGQDIPHMIAADHCKRLVVLIKRELEQKASARKEDVKDQEEDVKDKEKDVKDQEKDVKDQEKDVKDQGDDVKDHEEDVKDQEKNVKDQEKDVKVQEDDVKVHGKSVTFRRWTEDQDRHLMELVLMKNEEEGKVRYMSLIEQSGLDPMEMDWEGIALEFPGRNTRGVREHWKRTLQPLLVERFSPQSILSYRRRLVLAVQNQGARHRQQVDWVTLASTFHPKSVASLQQDLGDMTMYSCGKKRGTVETSTAFLRRLRLAVNGLNQMELLTEEQLFLRFRGVKVKQALYDHYQYLLTL